MSVLFIFLLGGVVKLSLSETLVIGVVSVAAQSFWHSRFGVRLVQIAFSIATIAIAITATDIAYHVTSPLAGPLRLFIAVSVFFLSNTFPIAVVVALTEAKDLRHVWSTCYLWCFPYYLVGAGVVSAFTSSHGLMDWQAAAIAGPIIYIIYKCYRLYLNRLTIEQERAEEEHRHAIEIAALHEKTVNALNSSVMANARLDAVFRASPLAIITLDGVGRITSWNAMAERIFGWSAEEVLGSPLPFASGRSEELVQDIVGRALHGEAIAGLEMRQWRKDGSAFEAAVWTAGLPDTDGGRGVLLTVADVSARKGLEEQLRLSQKLEAVGRLAGGIAHDFNNLLTIINGYSSLMIETVKGHQYAVSQAEEILAAGTRAAELVSQLLTFSRRQMIKPRPFEVNQFARDMERMLKRVIGEHIELRTRLHPDSGWIHADLNQMEAALLNLSTNARDAMPDGGVLTIETAPVDVTPNHAPPNTDLPPGQYVRLAIRDTGHGMDPETKQRLFEPFYTTKERGRGTGLGLPSVLGGVEQNNGRIFVTSELGKGSEFSIYLPRMAPPETNGELLSSRSKEYARGSETILLVEDEVTVRRILREALIKAGYRVWEASNGAEALKLWGPDISKVDLVVTDVVMPAMNGLRLIDELKRMRPDIRSLCMSGHSDDLLARQSSQNAPDLLRKPFLPELLVLKVRQILDEVRMTDDSRPDNRSSCAANCS
jgi:PAS domain S-box-containing protein